jgi:hypothetical protein
METQIKNLVDREKSKEVKQSSWWHEASVAEMLSVAFHNKSKFAILQGRRFNIKYTDEKAWVQLDGGFTPCGRFNVKDYIRAYEQSKTTV